MAEEKLQEVQTSAPQQSAAEMNAEFKRLELEEKRLLVASQKANLQDMEERLQERQLKRDNARQKSLINGQSLKATDDNYRQTQARCKHKKGGDGAQGVIGGQGNDSQYAVLKHKFANGDIWVRCLRCAKTWKPPVKRSYKTDVEYNAAMAEYKVALDFPTRNSMSAGVVFQFSDGGEFYREVTEQVNLR
jgi:hypothetical protein